MGSESEGAESGNWKSANTSKLIPDRNRPDVIFRRYTVVIFFRQRNVVTQPEEPAFYFDTHRCRHALVERFAIVGALHEGRLFPVVGKIGTDIGSGTHEETRIFGNLPRKAGTNRHLQQMTHQRGTLYDFTLSENPYQRRDI